MPRPDELRRRRQPLAAGTGRKARPGLLGLPLAFCALPLYVVMPHWYATTWGVPTAWVCCCWSCACWMPCSTPGSAAPGDAWARNRHGHPCGALAPWRPPCWRWRLPPCSTRWRAHALAWAGVSLALTYIACQRGHGGHQSWGVCGWGRRPRQRSTMVAWREAWGWWAWCWRPRPGLVGRWGPGALMAGAAAGGGGAALCRSAGLCASGHSVGHRRRRSDLFAPWRSRPLCAWWRCLRSTALPAPCRPRWCCSSLPTGCGPRQPPGVRSWACTSCARPLSMPLWLRAVARGGLARLGWAWACPLPPCRGALLGGRGRGRSTPWSSASGSGAGGWDLAVPAACWRRWPSKTVTDRIDQPRRVVMGRPPRPVLWLVGNLVAKLNLALAAGHAAAAAGCPGLHPGARDADSLFHAQRRVPPAALRTQGGWHCRAGAAPLLHPQPARKSPCTVEPYFFAGAGRHWPAGWLAARQVAQYADRKAGLTLRSYFNGTLDAYGLSPTAAARWSTLHRGRGLPLAG